MILFRKPALHALVLSFALVFTGCATTNTAARAFQMEQSQLQLRSIQSRAFDMTDKKKMMQAIISTMQD
ncbi:hypothetical protein HY605_04050, partial [Candidatus Peregrinibacteria bacterium]|nr:hypothetical protein [Candidatus Peregrinibacteria bacterium]